MLVGPLSLKIENNTDLITAGRHLSKLKATLFRLLFLLTALSNTNLLDIKYKKLKIINFQHESFNFDKLRFCCQSIFCLQMEVSAVIIVHVAISRPVLVFSWFSTIKSIIIALRRSLFYKLNLQVFFGN